MRERETYRDSQKENISPKPLTRKRRGADFHEFYSHWRSKTGVLEVHAVAGVKHSGFCSHPVEKDRIPRGRVKALRSPWDTLGETVPLSCSVSRRGRIVSLGTTVLAGTITLSHLLA